MPGLSSAVLAAGLIACLIGVAHFERRKIRARRRALLDRCRHLFDEGAVLAPEPDGFPRLRATWQGAPHHVLLFADTMTLRRLPQLWLSLTRLERRPNLCGFDLLIRPTGAEFYALSHKFPFRLDVPDGLPAETLIRGNGPASARLVERLAATLSELLADERIKEVAVTDRGLRIVRQASEGERGDHLILRQAVFENAEVVPADLETLLGALARISAAIDLTARELAA